MNRSRFVSLVFLIVLLVNQFAILQFVPSVKATSPEIYYSGAGDGCSGFGGEDVQTWAACHHATAGEYADYTAITVIAESYEITGVTGWNVIQRTFLPFNTAALPDTATITAATLSIYVTTTSDGDNDGYDYVSVVQTTQASTSAIVVEDYDQCGAVQTPQKGAADIDITGIGTGAYLAFTLNATGIAWISLTGWTKLGIREGHDVADHQIAANKDNYVIYSTSEATGTSQDPYLNITYTVGDITSPTYSNVGTNTTVVGQPCLFQTLWNDDVNVSGFIFGTNNTGTQTNETWVAFATFFNTTAAWSNVTKTLNATVSVRVEWTIYANDTANLWNSTGTQFLVTSSSGTRHMRSDSTTVNGLTAYQLATSQSTSALNITSQAVALTVSTVYPTSDGTKQEVPGVYPASPTTHYDKVDEAVANDTDYLYTGSANSLVYLYDTFGHTTFTMPGGQTAAYVRLYYRCKTTTAGYASFKGVIYVGTTLYSTTAYNDGSFTTYTYDWARNPSDNQLWNQTSINAMEIGVGLYSQSGSWYLAFCSQVYLEVYTYTDATVYYAIDVAKRDIDETETTVGTKVAEWSCQFKDLTAGLKTQVWTYYATEIHWGTSFPIIKVYQKMGAGSWNLVRTFTEQQIFGNASASSIWTVYYYLDTTYDASYCYTIFWHGNSTCNSKIENLAWKSTTPPTYSDLGSESLNGAKYYFRDDLPTQGQSIGNGNDCGTLLNDPATSNETRFCSSWIQYWFEGTEPIDDWTITQITWHIYWKGDEQWLGIKCNGTYPPPYTAWDYNMSIGSASEYQLYEANWTVNIAPPQIDDKYYFCLYLYSVPPNVDYPQIQSNETHQSYVIFNHGYTINFHSNWTDVVGLATTGGFIFGNNDTGSWQWEAWVPFSSNPAWSNLTRILDYESCWEIRVNNTSGNWNSTGIQYLAMPTIFLVGWNNFTSQSRDIGKMLEQICANIQYNAIHATIIIKYNGTEYRYDYGLEPNTATLVSATSDELRVYCTIGGTWNHDYGNFYYLKSAPSQSVSLSMVTVILISILKSASQAVTTVFSASRLIEIVRGASQKIGIGLSSLQFIGWIETVTLLIGIALATSRAAEFSGSATQSFSLGLSAERAAELAKSVIQTIATSLNVNRLIDVTRTTANTFSLSLASSRFAEFVRSASKTFNVGFATASLAEFFRSVSQALTATLNAQRLIEVFRSASQAITFSLQAIGERVGIYLRNVALTITLSLQGSRLAEWLRSVAQTISFTFETVGFAQFVRSASQAISVVLNGERMVELFRSASQTITIAFQTIGERVGIYLRNVALTITTAFEGSRLAEWIKATNQTISVTLGSSRLAEFVRTASQTITLAFTSAGEKLGNYIRNVVLTITTAFQNSRLADWTRQATQTLTLSLSTSRAAQFIALVVLTITTAFNASRLIELLRQVSQSLSFVLNGERLIEASRTVSQNITFTLQSIGEMVGNYFRNALLDVGFTFSTLAEVPEATILLTLAIALIVVACVVTFAVAKTQKEPEKN